MRVLKTPDDLIRERQDSARLYETAKDGVGEHKTPHCSIGRARRKSPSPNPTAPRPLTWNGLKETTHHIAITSNQLFIERLDCAPSWSCRLGFQSIAWDMRVWQGVWEGGWSCSESKWEEFFFFFLLNPSLLLSYHIGQCQYGPQRSSELRGGGLNLKIITSIFTPQPCAFFCPTASL